ncbi:hypothetical protein [Nostoc sp. MG11]|uniref:hypothetical protein n=1 Tax=Nostoc sp. MG11 TaxID=2721166 RepID=UPI001867C49D|nr:hypothetical protein [Nostoc sp. MG11]
MEKGCDNIFDELTVSTHHLLLKLGAKPHTDVQDVGDRILVATVTDPWENIFDIIENSHFQLEACENLFQFSACKTKEIM